MQTIDKGSTMVLMTASKTSPPSVKGLKQHIWKHVLWQAISTSEYDKEKPRNPANHISLIVTLEEEKVLVTLMLWR